MAASINNYIKEIARSKSDELTYTACLNLQTYLIDTCSNDTTIDNRHYNCIQKLLSSDKLVKMHNNSSKGLRIAILGYKIQKVGQWDPYSIKTGMPGSEEALIYVSKILSKNHNVTVFADPPPNSPWSLPLSNPLWLDCSNFGKYEEIGSKGDKPFDMVICWRNSFFKNAKKCGKRVYFWGHDSPSYDFGDISDLDGMFYLSEYHKNQFKSVMPKILNKPYTISGNGVVLEQFTNPKNFKNPYKCGYFSSYSRGLMILLDIWPNIKRLYPEATLDIYYGRETYGTLSDDNMQWIIKKLDEYKSLDVKECGKVGHVELANAMQETSILLYPCSCTAETFCITVVKCQLAGMIPITTRIGALDETVHPDAPGIIIVNNSIDINKYYNAVIETMSNITELEPSRDKYIEFAKKFTWEACTNKWLELHEQLSN